MRKRVFIACTMQIDIVKFVLEKYHINMPIIWVDRRLHNNTKELHEYIQRTINENQDVEEIILSYGLCQNAVLGLYSSGTKLVLSVFDDCICQALYNKNKLVSDTYPEKGCYYLTREWTIDQESIVSQCEQILKQYGKSDGLKIIQQIYEDYHSIVLIDTGAYDVEKLFGYVHKAANDTGMCVKVVKGSCSVMENLLLGNYDETVRIFNEGERITIQSMRFS